MEILLTLTSGSLDVGPFDLYSNVDGFVSPFNTNIPRSILVAGFIANVNNSTTAVRAKSKGLCGNYIDIILSNGEITTTTTSSSTTEFPLYPPYGTWAYDACDVETPCSLGGVEGLYGYYGVTQYFHDGAGGFYGVSQPTSTPCNGLDLCE